MSISVEKVKYEARIAGRIVPNLLDVTASGGFEQINAEGTIWTTARPLWADEGLPVTIWAQSGSISAQIHGGEVNAFDWAYAPGKVGIVCRDLLARTRLDWGGDEYEYTNQEDGAIIQNLLEKMGIPSSLTSIESSGWVMGVIEPIVLKEGVSPYSLIAAIDDLAGYKTYSLTTGVIVRRRISGIPGQVASLSFSKGVRILSDARRNRTRDGIVNRCIVTGIEYEGLTVGGPGVAEASAPNPYIPNPPGYITENIQSNLVEDDAKALEIAQRTVNDKNRRPESLDFSVPLEPRVQPGMTVQVVHPDLETGTATVFVQTVLHGGSGSSGARTTIRTTGGNLSGYALQPPVASFDVQIFREGEDTGSGVNTILVGFADGSQSFDPDGTIASYAWTLSATGGTPTPTSGTGPIFPFTVDGAATELVLTLTVTDADGQTGVLARTIPISSSTILVEDLYLAYGDVACSSDGEQTWRTATPASGSATCLMPFAPAWGQVWGTSTGHVYATFDTLLSPLVDLGQPHGAVACTAVWVHEVDTTRLWAGFSDGKVYQGVVDLVVQTCLFTLAGTVPDSPIIEIRESVGTTGELRATAGAGYYYSTNSGASWSLVHTFDTARRMAAGFDENMATGLNDSAPIYGETTTPTVPSGVTHLRALTFGWRTKALYATDDAAALYTTDDTFAALTAHADTLDAQGNHMVRSGNIDGPVIYAAIGDGTGTNNGFQKWMPGTRAPFYIRKTGSAAGLEIGYGPAHPPPIEYILLAGWENENPGGISVWDTGVWADKPLPVSGSATCNWIAAFDATHWLALFNGAGAPTAGLLVDTSGGTVQGYGWAHSPLWYTADGGTTWAEVSLTKPGSGLGGSELMFHVEWNDTGTGWLTSLPSSGSGGGAYYTGAAGTAAAPVPTPSRSLSYITAGIGGDFIIVQSNGSDKKVFYLPSGGTLTAPPGASNNYSYSGIDRIPGQQQFVTVHGDTGDLLGNDYKAGQPVIIYSGINARTLTAATDALYVIDGPGALQRIPTGGTATQIPGALFINSPRADRQSRTVVGAIVDTQTSIWAGTGGVGRYITGPSGKTINALEVVTLP